MIRKISIVVFWVLTLIDWYNCLIPGQEYNQMIRPIQMLVLLIWALKKNQSPINYLLFTIAMVIASFADYVFYKFGSTHENGTILLIIIKNLFFLIILYQNVKATIRPSKRLFRWTFNYIAILVLICFLIDGFDNWLAYILAIQSGIILLLISLQKGNSVLFNQLYFGYALIIMSLIFGKILLTDSRWFIELIDRFSFVFGHLLFVSGLARIKLLSNTSNISDYQTVE